MLELVQIDKTWSPTSALRWLMPSARVIVDINLYIMLDGLLGMKEWEVFYHICEPSKFDNYVILPVHEGNVFWDKRVRTTCKSGRQLKVQIERNQLDK